MTKGTSNGVNFPKLEEQVLLRWKREKTFEKSMAQRKNSPRFVFYEGPPTTNGRPGLHHVELRAFKDVMLRYKAMRGFFVPRRAGWDTHGLPVELEVEKQLGLKSKKDIEKYGIAKFNEECRKSVWKYQKEWEELTERAGMWLDMDNAYITYKTPYIETLWTIIKTWWQKGLLYKDYKVVPFCTRCGTALSSHELAQGYKRIKEMSVHVKFRAKEKKLPSKTFFLAWTTTPWTLPGNVALAVGKNIPYVLAKKDGEHYILAKELAAKLLKDYEAVKTFSGKELLGMKYEPLFRFERPEKGKKVWEVVPADFVSTEEGTGIVHTAVAYGADDFELGKKENLAMLHLVSEEGRFKKEAKPFAGKFVKEADPLIASDLKKRGLLLREELYEHDYPFCWRCSTPLLYYAKESWFVNMQKVKTKLLANNRKVNWIPSHLKEGRMGEWLKEVKDWAFSRERYWGTPLPVWECKKCQHQEAVGSLQDFREFSSSQNTYYLLRHGESLKQELQISSSWPEKRKVPLTAKGIEQVQKTAKKLKKEKIDIIVSSDLLRTKETAKIVAKELRLKVAYEKLLREEDAGIYNGKPMEEKGKFFRREGETATEHYLRRFELRPPKGENWVDVQKRAYQFLKEMEKKHKGKRILVVGHGLALNLMENVAAATPREQFAKDYSSSRIGTAEWRRIRFAHFPYNDSMEVDLHRPFVDEIAFPCKKCKGTLVRVKDVVDVWYDSGSMPFAQNHWLGGKPKEFPADYITEAIDQTRGWFYTLLAVSTLLGYGAPFKHVISLGHVLDEKGEKMSKSKGNIVSPWDMAEKYGMDAVRWYFFSVNHPWDPKLFSEKDLQLALRKFLSTLWNSLAFYETYQSGAVLKVNSKNALDSWIVSRLNTITADMTEKLDAYDITGAARILESFVLNDLSLWYIRRSRGRFQNPKSKTELREAVFTLRHVLSETALLSAPFAPFLAEAVFEKTGKKGSVHLQDWPKLQGAGQKQDLEKRMEKARQAAAKGLALRAKAGIRVRQPLASVAVKERLESSLLELLKDELNVKKVMVDPKAKEDIVLDTKLTPALKEEGLARELLRHIQDMRKDAGLQPRQPARMRYAGDASLAVLFERYGAQLKKAGSLKELLHGDRPKQVFDVEREVSLEGKKLWLGIRKN